MQSGWFTGFAYRQKPIKITTDLRAMTSKCFSTLALTIHSTTHAEHNSPTLKNIERLRKRVLCFYLEIEIEMLLDQKWTEYHADYALDIKLNTIRISMQSCVTWKQYNVVDKALHEMLQNIWTSLKTCQVNVPTFHYEEVNMQLHTRKQCIIVIVYEECFYVLYSPLNYCRIRVHRSYQSSTLHFRNLFIVEQIITDVMALTCVRDTAVKLHLEDWSSLAMHKKFFEIIIDFLEWLKTSLQKPWQWLNII